MEENQKREYETPELTVLEVQSESFMVPSSWGAEEG